MIALRFMQNSLSNLVDNLSEIDNKEPKDNMRLMIDLLLQHVNKISRINKKIAEIDNIEPDNIFTDDMRSVNTGC